MHERPKPVATSRVVPEPANGSKTRPLLQSSCPQSDHPSVTRLAVGADEIDRVISPVCPAPMFSGSLRHDLRPTASPIAFVVSAIRVEGFPHSLQTFSGHIAMIGFTNRFFGHVA